METNETIYDQPIADWQVYIDDLDVMINALRSKREFALNQMEKLNLERVRFLGNIPLQETFDL